MVQEAEEADFAAMRALNSASSVATRDSRAAIVGVVVAAAAVVVNAGATVATVLVFGAASAWSMSWDMKSIDWARANCAPIVANITIAAHTVAPLRI